ncbi:MULTISPECIES: Nif11-like leader peptide family RiPP precursor [Anoxynatronum]|uniref:Nif11-like leader peptide domain-containing protein n=2 Tax=Anoxynatronum TaxID=210622 RepID=A0AA45WW80_9CLOT|nr:Nif11-like leader peptide family RiPP precursor [Anoxynatronum buryatiense]SMP58030.1 nif11-like leader peptide domain-containing protein [Anoxynatronum buryatiense]
MEEKLKLLQQKLEADEQLVEKLMQQETPEEVQALLKENDVNLTIEEINEIREAILKMLDRMTEGELSEEDLEEVTGGIFFAYGVLALCGIFVALATGTTVTNMFTKGRW